MDIFKIILPTILILSCSAASWADSIVITFADQKTQTVILDEPIKSITSIKYLAENDQSIATPQAIPPPKSQKLEVTPPEKLQPEVKPKVRFKWAEPMEGQ